MADDKKSEDREALEEQIAELSAQGEDATRLWQIRDKLLDDSIE